MENYEEYLKQARAEEEENRAQEAAANDRAKGIIKEALREVMAEDADSKESKKEKILNEKNGTKRRKMINDNLDLFSDQIHGRRKK